MSDTANLEFDFSIDMADQRAFARLSGDHNPLHLDAEFARSCGMSGPVVYGGLIIAKISQVIGMKLPGSAGLWAALKVDFHEPLYLGKPAHLVARVSHRSVATKTMEVKLFVTSAGRTIASAVALAKLFDAPRETES